jgi:hypothetical protein
MGFDWRRLRDTSQERYNNRAWRAELTVLVQSDDKLREDGRRVCMTNLLALCYVLGYCKIDEKVHHEAIHFFPPIDPTKTVEHLGQGIRRRRTLLYPRNTYKSTLDMAYCVQLILHYFMTIAILILSGSKELSFAFVDEVAGHFIKGRNRPPTLFQALFPELCIERQEESGEFTTPERQTEPPIKEPVIWGNSGASSTTGWHPDVLIVDDLNNNRNSLKFESRVQVTKNYKLVRKILKPSGFEMKIGTCYGPGDIFHDEIQNSRPGTYDRVYKPAMRLKSGERLDPNGFPDEDEVELLFPSILSYEFLREEYDGEFESFMSQYMLDNYGAAEIVFAEQQMLAAVVDADDIPIEGSTHIHWRIPCQTNKWLTAAAAVGVIHRNRCHIVDVAFGHYKPSLLAKLIVMTARKHHKHKVAIEESPGARMMYSPIMNYALTVGWDMEIEWTEYEGDSGTRDLRIRNLEAVLDSTRLIFSAGLKLLKPLMNQFTQYGMIDEFAIVDVVSRVADNLPQSIAAETDEEEAELAWEQMRERDKYNLIYGRGPYARPEPEPEEISAQVPVEEEYPAVNDLGLENILGGLNG